MHAPINVKSPNNISEWQMGFNSAFKGLIQSVKLQRTESNTVHSVKQHNVLHTQILPLHCET
jgi:hypothetical protein